MGNSRHVLVVDDDRITCVVVAASLRQAGWTVQIAHTPGEALSACEEQRFTVMVTDLQFEAILDGIALFKAIRERQPFLRGILLSAHIDFSTILRVVEAGFDDCLAKPVDQELSIAVERSAVAFAHWTDRINTFRNLPS